MWWMKVWTAEWTNEWMDYQLHFSMWWMWHFNELSTVLLYDKWLCYWDLFQEMFQPFGMNVSNEWLYFNRLTNCLIVLFSFIVLCGRSKLGYETDKCTLLVFCEKKDLTWSKPYFRKLVFAFLVNFHENAHIFTKMRTFLWKCVHFMQIRWKCAHFY